MNMTSTTADDRYVIETRTSCNNNQAQKAVLREHRLGSYLGEPMSDGNRLVMLSAPSAVASYETITAAARSEMSIKMDKVMKPYYYPGKDL